MYYSKINKITNKCYINSIATLAQPVEQCFRKAEVPSSNLGGGLKNKRVWFSGKMIASQAIDRGSIPRTRIKNKRTCAKLFYVLRS